MFQTQSIFSEFFWPQVSTIVFLQSVARMAFVGLKLMVEGSALANNLEILEMEKLRGGKVTDFTLTMSLFRVMRIIVSIVQGHTKIEGRGVYSHW